MARGFRGLGLAKANREAKGGLPAVNDAQLQGLLEAASTSSPSLLLWMLGAKPPSSPGGGRLGMGTVGGGGEGGEGGTGGGDDGGGEGRVGAFTTKSTSQAGTTSHSPGEPMTWTVTRWAP